MVLSSFSSVSSLLGLFRLIVGGTVGGVVGGRDGFSYFFLTSDNSPTLLNYHIRIVDISLYPVLIRKCITDISIITHLNI